MVKKKSIYPYLLVAPALIIILCVVFIPVINAIGMSFQSYDLRRPNDIAFVGLANYIAAFKDELFWKALWKTILWVVFGVGFQFVFGFILALLLNKKFRGRGVVRAVSLIPWVTPGILIGLMWRWMYDGNYGVLNEILSEAVAMQQPPSDRGKRLKIFYMTQVGVKPPTFVIFVNDKILRLITVVQTNRAKFAKQALKVSISQRQGQTQSPNLFFFMGDYLLSIFPQCLKELLISRNHFPYGQILSFFHKNLY